MKLGFILKHYGTRLIGTTGSWFLFDIVFYGHGLFAGGVLESVGVDATLQNVTLQNLYLSVGAIPGYYLAAYTMDIIGRRNMQLQGFIFMAIIYFIMGFAYDSIKSHSAVFIVLYALTFFFANFGPNSTTFLIPVESYPTPLRATCHGFSAASGKTGAIVATFLFTGIKGNTNGPATLFKICGAICFVGIPLTWFFVTDRPGPISLLDDELESFLMKEDNATRERLSSSFAAERKSIQAQFEENKA